MFSLFSSFFRSSNLKSSLVCVHCKKKKMKASILMTTDSLEMTQKILHTAELQFCFVFLSVRLVKHFLVWLGVWTLDLGVSKSVAVALICVQTCRLALLISKHVAIFPKVFWGEKSIKQIKKVSSEIEDLWGEEIKSFKELQFNDYLLLLREIGWICWLHLFLQLSGQTGINQKRCVKKIFIEMLEL